MLSPTQLSLATRLRRPSLTGVLAVGVAVWGLGMGLLPLHDNSFLTHLATGRLLLDGGIPRHDPFSFTAVGEPWVVQSWLASLVYGLLDQWGGGFALLLFRAAVTMALGLLLLRLTRPAEQLLSRVLLTGVVMVVGAGAWSERPLLLGLLFLAVLLIAAEGGLDPRWMVPVMWCWVNVHGSFPLGLVALAALVIGRRLDGTNPGTELRVMAWSLVGLVLAVVNPLGPKLLLFPVHMLGRSDELKHIYEWQAPTFADGWQRVFLLQLVVAVVALTRRPSWRAALPFALFVAAALLAMRNVSVASLVLVPGTAAGLRGLGTITGERRPRLTLVAGVALASLGMLLVVQALGRPAFQLKPYPGPELAWMDRQGLLGEDDRVVTQEFVGNYREALEGRSARVFIDDRFDMYPSAVIADYAKLERGAPGWQKVLRRYEATAVLWQEDTSLGSLLKASPRWRVVRDKGGWLVAVPRR